MDRTRADGQSNDPRPTGTGANLKTSDLESEELHQLFDRLKLKPGDKLDNRYEIVSALGSGGMSCVLKARHLLMDKMVAIKILNASRAFDKSALDRFRQEAHAESSLKHPHIISVSSFTISDQGLPYIVMELIAGKSLAEVISANKTLPAARAVPIFKQTCQALSHAHSRNIIHRDIKPSNIMLVNEEGLQNFVKVVDFGIAKMLPQENRQIQAITEQGSIFGTAAFMSPEQCTGQALDCRSDIYSLGCLMYETLSGSPPFCGSTPMETMLQQTSQAPPPLSGAGVEISPKLEAIVMRCLEKEPQKRFQSAAALLEELDALTAADLTSSSAATRAQRHLKKMLLSRRAAVALAATVMLVAAAAAALPDYKQWQAKFILALTEQNLKQEMAAASSQDKHFAAKRQLAKLNFDSGNSAVAQDMYLQLDRDMRKSSRLVMARLNELPALVEIMQRAHSNRPEALSRDLAFWGKAFESLRDQRYLAQAEYFYQLNREHAASYCPGAEALALIDLAGLKTRLRDNQGAWQYLIQAKSLEQQPAVRDNIVLVIRINHELIKCYLNSGQLEKAERLLNASLRASSDPRVHLQYVETMRLLANCYSLEGKFDAASAYYNQLIAIQAKATDARPGDVAGVFYDQAVMYLKWGKPQQALPIFERALSVYSGAATRDERLRIKHMIADTCLDLKQWSRAQEIYKQELLELEKQPHPTLSRTAKFTRSKMLACQKQLS